MLNKANEYQARHTDRSRRPVFHFSVPVGWLNDPNGFSVYQDKVHLFYQYYPFGTSWSYMHWGHAVSTDLTFWEDLPAALAPDMDYDAAGCFSGTAIEVDGKQMLLYTGVSGDISSDGLPHGPQQQCLAVGDGRTYIKSGANPVIPTAQLPAGYLPQDFRDPKVWETDGHYRMAVAAAKPDGRGVILVFDSPDLKTWERRGALLENDGSYGTMWECPDVFSLDGSDVVLVSIIAMAPGKEAIHPGNPVLAFIGRADWDKTCFDPQTIQQLDEGRDFYAPQTLVMGDGRRILIGWMQDGFNRIAPPEQNWQGMMTYPRELSLADGRIVQQPAREITEFYTDSLDLEDTEITGREQLPGVSGRSLDLSLTLKELNGTYFRLHFASGPESEVTLTWQPQTRTLTFDRSHAGGGSRDDHLPVQSFHVSGDGPLSLRLLLDRNSLEVFVNGGRQVFTGIFYAPEDAEDILFSTDGRVKMDLEAHTVARP